MLRPKSLLICFFWFVADRLLAGDPGPTQTVSSDGLFYHPPIPVNSPFPSANYGADHGGSSLALNYPFLSPFGYTDHSRGQFVYHCASFFPRRSEGVFGMDLWLEHQNPDGSWSPVDQNSGLADNYGQAYQPVNTPNPGPSPSYDFYWTFDANRLPEGNFRVFCYIYIYNQGGGTQGDFTIYSATGPVSSGSINDAPRISWSPSSGGSINPIQIGVDQNYAISADAQDDNGNLIAVSINKNGAPFAYAGGGNGYSGNSQNPTSDGNGTVTYTAWATDSFGAQSPTITRTVIVTLTPPVGAFDSVFPNPVTQGQVVSGNGWAADPQMGAPVSAVLILIDGGRSGSVYCALGGGRPDVQAANATWGQWSPRDITYSGWTFAFNTAGLSTGNHTFTAIAYDSYGLSSPLGSQGFSVLAPQEQTVSISPANPTVHVGDSVTFTASRGVNDYVWGGNANGNGPSQTVNFPDVGSYAVSVYSLGGNGYTASNTALASVTVTPLSQTVSVDPPSASVIAGGIVSFSASGGQNGYIWAGAIAGHGNAASASFPNVGTYTVTVYSPAGGAHAQSNTASATVTVTPASQTVSLSPAAPQIQTGQSVTFTASGGINGYQWNGAASGTGPTQTVSFPNAGTYVVQVLSPSGGNFAASNTASATITVVASAASARVIVKPQGGDVKVENSGNRHNSQVLVPGP